MLNPQMFREYDIRGIADKDMDDADVVLIGKGIGTYLRRQGNIHITVGRDCRVTSDRYSEQLIQELDIEDGEREVKYNNGVRQVNRIEKYDFPEIKTTENLFDPESDGYFLDGLNKTKEFNDLLNKYENKTEI